MNSVSNLKFGFSPCPNDTYILDAIVNKHIDCRDINFDFFVSDVEVLNQKAFNKELDITKLSFHAWLKVHSKYILLNSGSALGRGCGPLLISKKTLNINKLTEYSVAIPGKNTTANLLLKIFYPEINNKKEMLFSDIIKAVVNEEVDAGLIIHEERFTYLHHNLIKIVDMGELWEKTYNLPLPLGGIFVRRSLSHHLINKINNLIYESIKFANKNPDISLPFIKKHSASLSNKVIKKHINLYVNDFSLNLGEEGQKAINMLCEKAKSLNLHIDSKIPNFLTL